MTTDEYIRTVVEPEIKASVDRDKRALFSSVLTSMLSMTEWDYGTWKRRNNLADYDHESRIEMIRARLNSDSPLNIVNQVRVTRYAHCGALIREGRELRATKRMAAKYAPGRMAAE